MAKKKYFLTKEQEEKILNLVKTDISVKKISDQVGANYFAVRTFLKNSKIVRKPATGRQKALLEFQNSPEYPGAFVDPVCSASGGFEKNETMTGTARGNRQFK